MKLFQLLFLVMAWMSCVAVHAQNPLKLTYKIGEEVTTAENVVGQLTSLLGGHERAMTVTEIAVDGYLNANDVKELRLMAGSNESEAVTSDGNLKVVDLSKAHFLAIGTQAAAEGTGNPDNFLTTESKAVVANGDNLPGWMFSHCGRLEKVTLNNASSISLYAFRGCAALKECTNLVSGNEYITKIDDHAFDGCSSLTLTDGGQLPQNLEKLGTSTFQNTAITTLTIPEKLTLIGNRAFYGCKSLTTLVFAGSLETTTPELKVLHNVFEECKKMNLADANGQLPNRIVNLGDRSFKDTGITKLILPTNAKLTGVATGTDEDEVGSIGYAAFQNCNQLETLTVPANVTQFNEVVLQNCTSLATIDFKEPQNITKIGKEAFCNTPKLKNQFVGKLIKVSAIGAGAFKNCSALTNEDLKALCQNIKRIEEETFWNCPALTEINIPSQIEYIGKSAFGLDVNIKKVTVSRGEQIEAVWDDGNEGMNNIFYKIDPNQVQVIFSSEAENNYKNYRNNIVKNGEDLGKNAFLYLLTKTLDENSTDYTVVAQRHADVKLHRTFKAGWNTLVLPFGATSHYAAEDVKCSRIFQKALNATNEANFMIATYRGLRKNANNPDNSVFYFLKYASYDTDPLDEFEPILVRMTQSDIDASNAVYTFENVELNFDWDNEKEYSASEVKERMGKKEDGSSYFDGNYNHDLNDKFGQCSYDDFYFTGTLNVQKGTATEGSSFIAPGDYIIQSNTFVKCLEGKNYALKGFRGYFKQQPNTSSTQSAKPNIDIYVVDDMGGTTAIDYLDGEKIGAGNACIYYDLNGRMVGCDASLLGKGVYIKNGKKFVVK